MTKTKVAPEEEVVIDKKTAADDIIRKRVYASVGTGLVPIPVLDVIALSSLQVEMVARLSGLYEIPFKKDLVKTAISAMVGGVMPVALTPMVASLIKLIPVVGYPAAAVTMSATGGAATYAIGKVFVQHFESGGTLLNFNAEKVKAYYQEKFQEGEKVAAGAAAK